jgi:hypothetical protein
MTYDNTTIQKNWWQRNWKWVVPSGCLGLLVIVGLFFGAIFLGVTSIMKNTDVYKETMAKAMQNPTIKAKLGSPIEPNGMLSGNIKTDNYSGDADIHIPIKGSKAEGVIHVIATKENNIWTYSAMTFYVAGDSKGFDILK